MATNKVKPAKRTPARAADDDVLATAHGLEAALPRVGAMDALDMRDIDRLCLPPRPDYSGPNVRRIRPRCG